MEVALSCFDFQYISTSPGSNAGFGKPCLSGDIYGVDFGPLKRGSFSELPREATVFYHGDCLRVLMNSKPSCYKNL